MSYTKHNFTDGSVLYASQLNDMDNAIADLARDPDMIIQMSNSPGSLDDPTGTVVSGSYAALKSKMDADVNYVPKIMIRETSYYGQIIYKRALVTSDVVLVYDSSLSNRKLYIGIICNQWGSVLSNVLYAYGIYVSQDNQVTTQKVGVT